MSVSESIKKARENGISDEQILSEIAKQNKEKATSFEKAKEKGATATDILEEIIKQNPPRKESTPPPAKERRVAVSQETREKEEKEREDFLKRLDSREKGQPLKEEAKPSKEKPAMSEEDESLFEGESGHKMPRRPEAGTKLWARILTALVLITIVIVTAAFLYWVLVVKAPPVSDVKIADPVVVEKEVITPRAPDPLIKLNPDTDRSVRFPIISSEEYLLKLRQYMKENHESELVYVVVEDQRKEEYRIFDMRDFFEIFDIRAPGNFFDLVDESFTFIVYPEEESNRVAFVARFDINRKEEMDWLTMRPWEETIERDFSKLFAFVNINVLETREELAQKIHLDYRVRYREAEETEAFFAYSAEEPLSVYSEIESDEIVGEMEPEENYLVEEEEDEWYKVALNEETSGWVEKNIVSIAEVPYEDAGLYYTITGDLIIFSTSLKGVELITERLR